MPYSPLSAAGRVLGHTLTLRGAGVLPSRVYPTAEAMLRYGLPLRTSTYLPLLTRTNYPISSTFPLEILFDSEREFIETKRVLTQPTGSSSASGATTEAVNRARDLQKHITSTDVGSHVVTTFNSAPMLDRIVKEAQKTLRYRMHTYCESYSMEADDWKEHIEDVLRIYDDYRHEETGNGDSDMED
ncbi:unnamed protein product [Phytomonas sp. EM1]|nr:unnamed protein product [Phytomonas sp. EM1]|eukprot:CCW59841.1 unnamed protein product [Phytomonas sp. isolate EM1]